MFAKMLPDLKGTIFIVTYGRSGSTLLQSLLQTIPGAHITGENNLALASLFEASRSIRRARRTWGQEPRPKTHPWFGVDRVRPKRFETRLVRSFVEEVLRPPREARWIGFKEIRYQTLEQDFVPFLEFCQRSFPNPVFVFNSRNGLDVSKSRWWANKPRETVLDMVATMDARFAEFAGANPACSHRVFHEQTRADLTTLRPLFDKLGEPFDLKAARKIAAKKLRH